MCCAHAGACGSTTRTKGIYSGMGAAASGHDLRSCQSRLPRGRIGIHGNIFASGSEELGGEVLAGA